MITHHPRLGRGMTIALLATGLLLLGWAILDPLVTHFTRKALNTDPTYRGNFDDVEITLFPPGYAIEGLSLREADARPRAAPLVYCERAHFGLAWNKLLHARLAAEITVDNPKLVVLLPETMPQKKARAVPELAQTLEKSIPLTIDMMRVTGGEILMQKGAGREAPRLWLHHMTIVARDFSTRQTDHNLRRARVDVWAKVEQSGVLQIHADVNPFVTPLSFALKARLKDLRLRDLHDWSKASGDVYFPKGTLSSYLIVTSANGRISGGLKPVVQGADAEATRDGVWPALEALAVDLGFDLFDDKHDRVATVLPITGTLKSAQFQGMPAVLGVLRNAWVRSIRSGFSHLPAPTADDDQSFITQVAEALDASSPAPKAQPGDD